MSHETCSQEPEIQEEAPNPEGRHNKDVKVKEFQSQTEKQTISPLTLLKEDLSLFKEEVMKVFKDKDTNPRASQSGEKPRNTLTLLKEDFNLFKEDLSSVFKIGQKDSKEVAAKEESSGTSAVKTSKPERAEEPLRGPFRGDRNLLKTQSAKKRDEHSFRKLNREMDDHEESENTDDGADESEPGELDANEWSQTLSASNTEFHGFNASTCTTGPKQRSEDSPVVSGEASLSSGLVLWSLTDDLRNRSMGDVWSLKNFASYLTFDPNTANPELHLSEGNRRATRMWQEYRSSEHTERFRRCPQVLCREGLLDAVYWEVAWCGGADVGVTYNSISRDGEAGSCLLGHNELSWSLECSEGGYTPCHNGKRFKSTWPEPFTRRVGLYLNWPAGSLSFYGVSEDEMVHLHTFTSAFTQPLYPGFWVWAGDGSVALCQVELGWERLLKE
ncbi:uncharacterized protein PAE49_017378 isoform 2-T3 [Odontesthes bonariensis]|uniref:uncharacterized protein LOC142400818 isoform X2 n=1 Tax=Odontesthes bonariensis TaxID=219752 RepID=UPI003F582FA9